MLFGARFCYRIEKGGEMFFSSKIYRLLQKVDEPLREVLLALLEEMEQQRQQWEQTITKKEFSEFAKATEENFKKVWKTLQELAEAQRRTEERLNRLEEVVRQLAEAQRRTEEQVKELAEAQRRTEERLNRLEEVVRQLAEAQRRTEEQVKELAEAQRHTEERLNRLEEVVRQLAEAQRRTEGEIQRLTKELAEVKDRLEGISNSVGYSLENRAYRALPPLLKRDFGIEVTTPLVRKYIPLKGGKLFQANIYGKGKRNGEEVIILGECKVRPSKKEVNKFLNRIKQVEEVEGQKVIALIVAHDFRPEMEKYLQKHGIKYYWSYQLE